jgi:hypothetical protein
MQVSEGELQLMWRGDPDQNFVRETVRELLAGKAEQ